MQKTEIREAITLENQGEKIFGIMHRPLDRSSRVPAVLICSGFAGSKAGKFRLFVTLGEELAKNGIALLRFDYRGAGDSEGAFKDITLESKVGDTLTCLNFLAADSQIDSSRIGLLGRSLGGAIAILAARRYRTIKSLALWAPIFKSEPWKKLWMAFSSNQLGSEEKEMLKRLPAHIPNIEFLKQFFALNIEQELEALKTTPLFHLHGAKDKLVTIEHALDFEKARKGLNQTRFVQLPESDHDFSEPLEQEIAIEETVKWYRETL